MKTTRSTVSTLTTPPAAIPSPGLVTGACAPLLHEEARLLRHVTDSVRFLVIHCSATREDRPYTASQLERDHRARGFRTTGYHFYIRRDGSLYHPRLLGEEGAHTRGFNRCSIGICYEGGLDARLRPRDTRTPAQRQRLTELLTVLRRLYPQAVIVGHRDLDRHKACPCFDAAREYGDTLFR